MKVRVAIFNLKGKVDIWWEDLSNAKAIQERELPWDEFEKYLRDKYMSARYYNSKVKVFHELKLAKLILHEYTNKLLEILRCVPYIKDEKVKIHRYLSGLPQSFKDRIKFDEPKTLEDTILKIDYNYCYTVICHRVLAVLVTPLPHFGGLIPGPVRSDTT